MHDRPFTWWSFQVPVAAHLEGCRVLVLIWTLSVRIRSFLRQCMPTNIALDAVHRRRGLKWGVRAMLLAVPYLFAAVICVSLLEPGGPVWLQLLVLLYIWNAFKFIVVGPLSLVWLTPARLRERHESRIGVP